MVKDDDDIYDGVTNGIDWGEPINVEEFEEDEEEQNEYALNQEGLDNAIKIINDWHNTKIPVEELVLLTVAHLTFSTKKNTEVLDDIQHKTITKMLNAIDRILLYNGWDEKGLKAMREHTG